MAATTISDLPLDALVLIFRAVFGAPNPALMLANINLLGPTFTPCSKVHKKLRSVCREWRDAADIAFIESRKNCVELSLHDVRNPATVRPRFPSLTHHLRVLCNPMRVRSSTANCNAANTALAVSSLCASPDLRRVLKSVHLADMCCRDAVASAVSTIVACPHLTSLLLGWWHRGHVGGDRLDMLVPLGALKGLKELAVHDCENRHADTLPTLPDCPTLTSLALRLYNVQCALVGSDAVLGRLRRLSLEKSADLCDENFINPWAYDDPFGLRAALGAGVWRPHLLTGLEKLHLLISCDGYRWNETGPLVYDGGVPAAAVWAPLVPTVTELKLSCNSSPDPELELETGIYAGLGVLTGLQALAVRTEIIRMTSQPGDCPVDFEHVHLPNLTFLSVRDYLGPRIDVARFPRLVHLESTNCEDREPLKLLSVAALSQLASLCVSGRGSAPAYPILNLAELFGGGRPLAALTRLSFEWVTLEWDVAAAPVAARGAAVLSAAEFAARAGAMLPSLRSVKIKIDDDYMDDEVEEFVVPALRALGGG